MKKSLTGWMRLAAYALLGYHKGVVLTRRCVRWVLAAVMAVATGSAAAWVSVDRGAYDWSTARAYVGPWSWTSQQARPNWMATLPDAAPLGALSIPGTHNSLARFNSVFEREWGWHTPDWASFGATQWMDVRRQLQTGVRFLDVRFRHVNNELAAHHGEVFQGVRANDVFGAVQAFLYQYPSETVVMRVREEYSASGNHRSFAQTLEAEMSRYPGLFWAGGAAGRVPSLGEVRGKVVMLQNFTGISSSGAPLGLDYGRSAFIRDDWNVPFLGSLPGKWRSIEEFAHQARRDVEVQDRFFFINFLSGTGWFMPPWAVASGQRAPHNGSAFLQLSRDARWPVLDAFPSWCPPWSWYCTDDYIGTNYLFLNWMRQTQPNFVGVVAADFPGPALIQSVIDANQKFAARRYFNTQEPLYRQAAPVTNASVDIRTGPIFSTADAQGKCPQVCSGAGRRWNTNWTTVVPGQVSVCGCQ